VVSGRAARCESSVVQFPNGLRSEGCEQLFFFFAGATRGRTTCESGWETFLRIQSRSVMRLQTAASAHPIVFSGEIGFKCVVACSIGELNYSGASASAGVICTAMEESFMKLIS
jgi:hypothetical protein